MDYLNYGKQVEQKPQGFGQQKVELNSNDFTFGDLISQPTPPPPVDDTLMSLFPTPLLICPCPFEYGKELEWIKKQNCQRENKSTQTGQHLNRQSQDSFILDHPEMLRVREFIQLKLKEFVVRVMGSDSEMVITQSWLNRNGKGESHHEHRHPNSMFSGVWYPQIHEKLPPIQFRDVHQRDIDIPIEKYNHFNSSTFMLPMNKGELILFPSNLTHSVPPNQSDEERISLSFNTWCKGNLGNERSLTYLPFDRLM